jgi:hypothetical protein
MSFFIVVINSGISFCKSVEFPSSLTKEEPIIAPLANSQASLNSF